MKKEIRKKARQLAWARSKDKTWMCVICCMVILQSIPSLLRYFWLEETMKEIYVLFGSPLVVFLLYGSFCWWVEYGIAKLELEQKMIKAEEGSRRLQILKADLNLLVKFGDRIETLSPEDRARELARLDAIKARRC